MNIAALSAKKVIRSWLWDAFPRLQLCVLPFLGVSCGLFLVASSLEPYPELVDRELIPYVSWSCSQVLDIYMDTLPRFIKQLLKKSSRRAWGT